MNFPFSLKVLLTFLFYLNSAATLVCKVLMSENLLFIIEKYIFNGCDGNPFIMQ